jgi:hypothetical protein
MAAGEELLGMGEALEHPVGRSRDKTIKGRCRRDGFGAPNGPKRKSTGSDEATNPAKPRPWLNSLLKLSDYRPLQNTRRRSTSQARRL